MTPLQSLIKDRDSELDTLIDGMKPKVSNFGRVQDDEVKEKMQSLFDMWWLNADEFYRNPLKSFNRTTIRKTLKAVREMCEENRRMETDYDDEDKHARRDVRPYNEALSDLSTHLKLAVDNLIIP